ncbi:MULTISPECIES: hypothetical protein [unclassified Moorena]|uniref:hypothetical protein n=1 Tax=unclassified Moorena TaxID=2683338 RepID=UPI0013C73364|nr:MULTISPECIES: hypothetical protein [unclassified Moorena]NEO19759.1 hypothetical protein [Moorena sp. SIO4A5]NEP27372.1 hypothetical protein [Moorena sp. SIO3I6]NEQ56649.1 hypothetical protein [Moorena sp. SIO4A1]
MRSLTPNCAIANPKLCDRFEHQHMRLANRRLTEVSVVTKVKREWLPRQKSIRDHTRPRNQPNIDEHCHSSTTRRFSQTLRVQSTSLLPLIRHDLQDIE